MTTEPINSILRVSCDKVDSKDSQLLSSKKRAVRFGNKIPHVKIVDESCTYKKYEIDLGRGNGIIDIEGESFFSTTVTRLFVSLGISDNVNIKIESYDSNKSLKPYHVKYKETEFNSTDIVDNNRDKLKPYLFSLSDYITIDFYPKELDLTGSAVQILNRVDSKFSNPKCYNNLAIISTFKFGYIIVGIRNFHYPVLHDGTKDEFVKDYNESSKKDDEFLKSIIGKVSSLIRQNLNLSISPNVKCTINVNCISFNESKNDYEFQYNKLYNQTSKINSTVEYEDDTKIIIEGDKQYIKNIKLVSEKEYNIEDIIVTDMLTHTGVFAFSPKQARKYIMFYNSDTIIERMIISTFNYLCIRLCETHKMVKETIPNDLFSLLYIVSAKLITSINNLESLEL